MDLLYCLLCTFCIWSVGSFVVVFSRKFSRSNFADFASKRTTLGNFFEEYFGIYLSYFIIRTRKHNDFIINTEFSSTKMIILLSQFLNYFISHDYIFITNIHIVQNEQLIPIHISTFYHTIFKTKTFTNRKFESELSAIDSFLHRKEIAPNKNDRLTFRCDNNNNNNKKRCLNSRSWTIYLIKETILKFVDRTCDYVLDTRCLYVM